MRLFRRFLKTVQKPNTYRTPPEYRSGKNRSESIKPQTPTCNTILIFTIYYTTIYYTYDKYGSESRAADRVTCGHGEVLWR